MTDFQHENTSDAIEAFDYPKPLDADPDIYKLMDVLASENKRLDLDIEHLYDQRFIDSASGSELEKIGFEVGVKRRNDETDEHLRRRIIAAYASQTSDTTYESVAAAIVNIIGADPTDVSLTTPPESGDKNIEVAVSLSAIEDSPLSDEEILDIIEATISADASVSLLLKGTFGFTGDEQNEGFNEGTWSSRLET